MVVDRFRQRLTGFRTVVLGGLALFTGLAWTLFILAPGWGGEIGSGTLQIAGTTLRVEPLIHTVDLNMSTVIHTHLEGYDPELGPLPSDLRVVGDLSGPEIDGVLVLETVPNEPFRIPALRVGGDYELANIRLVQGDQALASAADDLATVKVTQILLTRVTSRPLTDDEIRSYGLVLDSDNYQALNLTFAFHVAGRTIEYNMPVVYDLYGPNVRFRGLPSTWLPMFGGSGNTVREGRFTPPRLVPFSVKLDQPEQEVIRTGGCDPSGGSCRETLPPEFSMVGMILFPTEVSLLHQYFSVVLSVQNGAPDGDPLVVRDLMARINLPSGLRLGVTEPPTLPGAPTPVRTDDGQDLIGAQEQGEAQFLIEGAEAGTYIVQFDMEGFLEGLPGGVQRVTGEAKGAVMVHDPYLAVRVAHPQTVREDIAYTVYFTVTNLGNGPVNNVSIALPPAALSGVEILPEDDGVVHYTKEIGSLLPGESEVVEFPIQSKLTGSIISTAVNTGSSTKPEFQWSLQVGVAGALSGDSLSVPTSSANLPSEILRPALALTGLGYSLAKAPSTVESTLPRVSMGEVNERIYRLSEAGRHRELGEDLFDVVAILACELNGARDHGWNFDQLRREHDKGEELADAVAAQLSSQVSSPEEAFERFAATTHFLGPQAVLAVGDGVTVEVVSRTSGKAVAGSGPDAERVRSLPFAELYDLAGDGMEDAEMVVLLNEEESGGYQVRLRNATGGLADLHLMVPDVAGELRMVRWTGVDLAAAAEAVVEFQREDEDFILTVDDEGDGLADFHLPGDVEYPAPRPFEAIAAVQDATVDPSGHVIHVLFSEDVDLKSLLLNNQRDPNRFVLPGNVSNGGLMTSEADILGGLLGTPGVATPLEGFGNPRIVRVIFDNPVSPLVEEPHQLTVSSLTSAGGRALSPEPQTVTVTTTATKLAIAVEGTVIGPDGNPVPNAQVALRESDLIGTGGNKECLRHTTAATTTDADGHYRFDYVRQPGCDDYFEIKAQVPEPEAFWGTATGRVRIIEGDEPLRLNVVMPGRGSLRGQVRYQDGTIPDEIHVVASNRNRNEGRLAHIGDNGFYDVDDVVVGTVTLAAYDAERNFVYRTVELPEAGAEVKQDLIIVRRDLSAPPPGRLHGTVVLFDDALASEDYPPAVDAYVALYVNDELIAVERSDLDGRYDFGLVPIGIAEIEAFSAESRMSGARLFVSIESDRTVDQKVTLRDDRGVVRGCVRRRSWEHHPEEEDELVVGAVVWAHGTPFHATTDEDGCFVLEDVFAGTWKIHAVDLQSNEATSTVATITSNGEVDTMLYFDEALPQGGILGRVLSYDDTPVQGATIHLAGGYASTHWHNETATDDGGYFKIEGLGAGVYGVHAIGGMAGEATVEGGGLGWANVRFPGATAYAEVKYRKGTIRVCTKQIQDNGNEVPVASQIAYRTVEVVARWEVVALAEKFTHTSTDPDDGEVVYGCLDIEALIGPYQIYIYNGTYGTRYVTGELTADGDPPDHIIYFKPTSTIRGVLYDHDGETPVTGATVSLYGGDYAVGEYVMATGKEGEFTFPMLTEDNTYGIDVSYSDGIISRKLRTSVNIRASGEEVDLELVLPEQGSVTGQVVSQTVVVGDDGVSETETEGIPRAVVTLYEAAYPHRRLVQNADSEGYFAFDNIAAGAVTVRAVVPELGGLGGRAEGTITCEAFMAELEVVIEPVGEVFGKVTGPEVGDPAVPNAQVWIVSGTVVDTSTSDENGEYRFHFLPEGSYQIRTFDPNTGRNGSSTWFQIEPYQAVQADTHLQVRGTVEGTFYDETDDGDVLTKIPGSVIRLTPSGGYHSAYCSTDVDGGFEFEGIPEGEFTLYAREEGGRRTASAGGEIVAENETVPVNLILKATGTVTGQVLNPPGMEPGPFDDVNVRVVQDGQVIGASIGSRFEFDGLIVGRRFQLIANEIASLRQAQAYGEIDEAGDEAGDEPPTINLTMQAMGSVTVRVTDNDNVDVDEPADVLVDNRHHYGREYFYGSTGGDPEVSFDDIREGKLWTRATNPQGLQGSTSGVLTEEGETVVLTVKLEPTGTIRGRGVLPDGVHPAAFATVALNLQGDYYMTEADEGGNFELASIPMGSYQLIVQEHAGAALIERLGTLTSNGQVDEYGDLQLDGADPYVDSIAPPSGTRGLEEGTNIEIAFSEPIDPVRSQGALVLRKRSGTAIGCALTWDEGNTTVTMDPIKALESGTGYDVDILEGIYDVAGRNMAWRVRSTFYVRDYIPPTVIHMVPADKANQVPVDTAIRVTFSEPVQVASLSGTAFELWDLTGNVGVSTQSSFLLDDDLLHSREAIFTHGDLEPDRQYQITVNGVLDEGGLPMAAPVVTTFWTPDETDPSITWNSPQVGAEFTAGDNVLMEVVANDNRGLEEITFTIGPWSTTVVAGSDPGSHVYVDSGTFSAELPAPIMEAAGGLDLTVRAVDVFGNDVVATRTIQVAPLDNPNSPEVVSPCPVDGDLVAPGLEIPIPYAITDDHKIESYWLEVAGEILEEWTPVNEPSADGTFLWTPPADAVAGQSFELRIHARDFAGNQEGTHAITLTVPDTELLTGDQTVDGSYAGQSLALAAGTFAVPGPLALSELVILHAGELLNAAPAMELAVTGVIKVQCGGVIQAVGTGYAAGDSDHPAGYGPPGIATSSPDGGGSHGGLGSVKELEGPVGEIYDSVYRPSLGGAGGASYAANGGRGGGVVTIAAGELVVDGEIQAAGEIGGGTTAGGAGGSVRITAETLAGTGLIDASGGVNSGGYWGQAGAGGGGRVALDVGAFNGFDPATQVSALGVEAYTGSGTVYFKTAASTYGSLRIDGGDVDTELPALGGGTILATEVDGNHLWVTGSSELRIRWLGAWMDLLDGDGESLGTYEVVDRDAGGRLRLLVPTPADAEDAAAAVSYRGEYRFDEITLVNGGLKATDPVREASWIFSGEGDFAVPADFVATEVLIGDGITVRPESGGELKFQVDGTMTIAQGARLDVSGLGLPDGTAPELVAGAGWDAGGSHGGSGLNRYIPDATLGEIYDGVLWPSLPGAAGAVQDGVSNPGGGLVALDVGTLVLDGEILARGDEGFDRPGGAGGSVLIEADTMSGLGGIDVSGGDSDLVNAFYPYWVGAGGGGRIAIHAKTQLSNFDVANVANRINAQGGINDPSSAGSGTLFVHGPDSIYGDLVIDYDRETHFPIATVLPSIGQGIIGTVTPGPESTDLWIEPQDPATRFSLGVVGMWVRINEQEYLVIGERDRRSILLEDAAGGVDVGDAYLGLYRFDSVNVLNGATLEFHDADEVGTWNVDADSEVIRYDWQAPVINIVEPAEGASFSSGAPIAVNAEVTDNTAVVEVRFELAGRSFVATEAPYAWVVAAPAAAVPTDLVLTVEAVDDEGNRISATRNLHLEPVAAGAPPVVTVACGQDAVVAPGTAIEIRIDALSPDAIGIDRVELYLGDATEPAGVAFDPPYVFRLSALATATAGDLLSLRAVAVDFAAEVAEVPLEVLVVDGQRITADTTLAADDLSLEGATVVVADSRLTVAGTHHFGNLFVLSGVVEGVAEQPLDLQVDGTLRIHCGAQMDVSGQGYPGVAWGASAPEEAMEAEGDAGGSYGGVGLDGFADSSPGEVFDSVSWPSLGGGSGGGPGNKPAGSGGGTVKLDAGTVIVDGEILAHGGDAVTSGLGGGAGGAVVIKANVLQGDGRIEASGGLSYLVTDYGAGAGGGGRVALHVDDLTGFDPATQVEVYGGTRYDWANDMAVVAHAGPGTIYVTTPALPNGALIIDGGTTETRPATPLPVLGSGEVTAITPLDDGSSDAWVSSTEAFRPRWLDAWMVLHKAAANESWEPFQVKDLDDQGRVRLAGAAIAVGDTVAYHGEHRFDAVTLRGGGGLDAQDPVWAGEVHLFDQATLPTDLDADHLTVHADSTVRSAAGGEIHLTVSGTLTVAAEAALDVSGQGYPGGPLGGQAPEWLGPQEEVAAGQFAGGSHGGVGLDGKYGYLKQPGEPYDSVYWPFLGGGGGGGFDALHHGGDGGGVLFLEAGTLDLQGAIRANGITADEHITGGGAGGTIVIAATAISGAGRIEASGGSSRLFSAGEYGGAGGGGRVTLDADQLTGFDPATQIEVRGGTRYQTQGEVDVPVAVAAPGTLLVTGPWSPDGNLFVDQGAPVGLSPPHLTLPAIGRGVVGTIELDPDEPDPDEPDKLWIEPQNPETIFSVGVAGMWVRIGDDDYRVVAESQDRRHLLLAGATTAEVAVGAAFRGVYHFNEVTIRGGTTVEFHDFVEADSVVTDDDSEVNFLDQTPPTIDAITPAEGTAFYSGDAIAISVESSDDTGASEVRFDFAGQSFSDPEAPFTWSVTAPEVAESADFVLTVTALDAEGNEATATRTIRVEVVCTFTIDPIAASFPAAGGTGAVTVTTPASCDWTAGTAASWIQITAGSSGTGPGTVDYQVTANPSTETRAGALSVAGQTHTVTQAGLPTYLLSVLTDGSGAGTVTSSPAGVDCGADCGESLPDGTLVTLTATPAADARFAGWTGACSGSESCTLTMTADLAVTATFAQVCTNPWTGNGPDYAYIETLARVGSTLYAGTSNALFESTDGGANWGMNRSVRTYSLTSDPNDSSRLYAGTNSGVLRSIDGGITWSSAIVGGKVKALAVDPADTATVYAGVRGSGVLKSSDYGVTWQPVSSGLTDLNLTSLAIDPNATSTLYAGTELGGIFKSVDGGGGWTAVNTGLSSTNVRALAIDPLAPANLFATAADGVYRSADGAASWELVLSGNMTSLSVTVGSPLTVYAGDLSANAWKSSDGGATWELVADLEDVGSIYAIAIDSSAAAVYLGTSWSGVIKSVDDVTWNEVNHGLNGGMTTALAIDPASPAIVYVGNREGRIYKTVDGGASWNRADAGLPGFWVTDVVVDPTNPSTVYASNAVGVYKSVDGGGLWTDATTDGLVGEAVSRIAIDPAGTLVAATSFAGVYRTTDGGGSWQAINTGLSVPETRAIAIDPGNPSVLYVSTSPEGLFKSEDAGQTWTAVGNGLPDYQISVLVVDPINGSNVYAAIYNHGVYKSTDGGVNWSLTGMGPLLDYTLAIHPTDPRTLYASTRQYGVYQSVDGGATWYPRNEGRSLIRPADMAIAPQEPYTVFISTKGRSVQQLIECAVP